MDFASDNSSGAAGAVMAAIAAANEGYSPSYGTDRLMTGVRDEIRHLFEAPEAAVYLVATGTAANALATSLLCPPWGAIYCHADAHIEVDECGAPEFFIGGGKTAPIGGGDGKITAEALAARITATPKGDVHATQPGMLSLTNLTEAGTLYRPAEIAGLAAIARAAELGGVHLDGARLANAIVAADAAPAEMGWRAGVDVLTLGGTKNGCMGVEAVVIFDPARAWEFELRRKRAGHLFSKHRFLSAQMAAYLKDGLWLKLAGHANRMATRLADGITTLPGGSLLYPVEGNIVFGRFPRHLHRKAMAAGARYFIRPFPETLEGHDDHPVAARLVCSWSTRDEDVERFLDILRAG